jgi:hypothetical protein
VIGHRRLACFSVAAFAVTISLSTSNLGFAQSAPQITEGPTYSSTEIRHVEIAGIRLGMSPQSVADAMSARGFRLRNPSGVEGGGFYESDDRRVWISVSYSNNDARPELQSFSYQILNYSAEEAAALAERRAELTALLGEPTLWTRWTNERGEIADQFVYVPRRRLIEFLDQASSCYANWECVSLLEDTDCRPLIHRVRVPVIQGSFGYRSLNISVVDYAGQARELLSDEKFQRRDLSQTACLIPSVH